MWRCRRPVAGRAAVPRAAWPDQRDVRCLIRGRPSRRLGPRAASARVPDAQGFGDDPAGGGFREVVDDVVGFGAGVDEVGDWGDGRSGCRLEVGGEVEFGGDEGFIVAIAISTTFNAVTVALPKLFAERLADLTKSPALLGVIAAGVYVPLAR